VSPLFALLSSFLPFTLLAPSFEGSALREGLLVPVSKLVPTYYILTCGK